MVVHSLPDDTVGHLYSLGMEDYLHQYCQHPWPWINLKYKKRHDFFCAVKMKKDVPILEDSSM